MPRVLHVIPALWSRAGKVVTRLCTDQRRCHDVAIVTADRPGDDADWASYRSTLHAHDVAHHTLDFLSRDPEVFRASVQSLSALIEQWNPAVVHAHAGVPTAGVSQARARLDKQFRFIAHCYSWRPDRPVWMNRIDLEAFARADVVVCSARAYERKLVEGGVDPRRVVYLPWGLALDEVDHVRARVSRVPRTIVGCLGRLEPRKGQLELCHALAEYRRYDSSVVLELVGPVGDLDYARQVERCVADGRLRETVWLRGQVDRPLEYVAAWDLAVSMSTDEGQGLAVLEAMALGVPVLARSSAGVEDFLRDGHNGFVLDANASPTTVAEAIAGILATPERKAAAAGEASRFVHERYDWRETVSRIDDLYSKAPLVSQQMVA